MSRKKKLCIEGSMEMFQEYIYSYMNMYISCQINCNGFYILYEGRKQKAKDQETRNNNDGNKKNCMNYAAYQT